MKNIDRKRDLRGSGMAPFLAVVVLVMFTLVAVGMLNKSRQNVSLQSYKTANVEVKSAADDAVQFAVNKIQEGVDATGANADWEQSNIFAGLPVEWLSGSEYHPGAFRVKMTKAYSRVTVNMILNCLKNCSYSANTQIMLWKALVLAVATDGSGASVKLVANIVGRQSYGSDRPIRFGEDFGKGYMGQQSHLMEAIPVIALGNSLRGKDAYDFDFNQSLCDANQNFNDLLAKRARRVARCQSSSLTPLGQAYAEIADPNATSMYLDPYETTAPDNSSGASVSAYKFKLSSTGKYACPGQSMTDPDLIENPTLPYDNALKAKLQERMLYILGLPTGPSKIKVNNNQGCSISIGINVQNQTAASGMCLTSNGSFNIPSTVIPSGMIIEFPNQVLIQKLEANTRFAIVTPHAQGITFQNSSIDYNNRVVATMDKNAEKSNTRMEFFAPVIKFDYAMPQLVVTNGVISSGVFGQSSVSGMTQPPAHGGPTVVMNGLFYANVVGTPATDMFIPSGDAGELKFIGNIAATTRIGPFSRIRVPPDLQSTCYLQGFSRVNLVPAWTTAGKPDPNNGSVIKVPLGGREIALVNVSAEGETMVVSNGQGNGQ